MATRIGYFRREYGLTLAGSVLAVCGLAAACSTNSFNSATPSAGNASGTGPASQIADAANGGGSGGNGSNTGANGSGSGGANSGANGGGGGGGTPVAQNGGQCNPNVVPINYNIMFIFDKTGSQVYTDPTLVRRSGALNFLSTFSAYAATYPKAIVNMSVMAFNTVAIPEGGWTLLNSASTSILQQEIVAATSSPYGETSYSPALIAAATGFNQVNQQPQSAQTRNYAIFLTDGDPNTDTNAAITSALNNLVTNYGVAMIAIATALRSPIQVRPRCSRSPYRHRRRFSPTTSGISTAPHRPAIWPTSGRSSSDRSALVQPPALVRVWE